MTDVIRMENVVAAKGLAVCPNCQHAAAWGEGTLFTHRIDYTDRGNPVVYKIMGETVGFCPIAMGTDDPNEWLQAPQGQFYQQGKDGPLFVSAGATKWYKL